MGLGRQLVLIEECQCNSNRACPRNSLGKIQTRWFGCTVERRRALSSIIIDKFCVLIVDAVSRAFVRKNHDAREDQDEQDQNPRH